MYNSLSLYIFAFHVRGHNIKKTEPFRKGEIMFYRYDDQMSPRLALKTRMEVDAVLKKSHNDSGSGGHRGVTIMLKKLEMSCYWKMMTADVKNLIRLDHNIVL